MLVWVKEILVGSLRIQRTPTTVSSAVVGLVYSGITEKTSLILLTLAIFFFHTSAGLFNDLSDIEVDKLREYDRPIVRNTITRGQARIVAWLLVLAALVTTFLIDPMLGFLAATVGLAIEFAYNIKVAAKNHPLGSFLYLTFTISPIPFLVGCFVARNLNQQTLSLAIMLGALSSCIATGSFKDVGADQATGKRTFVVALGIRRAANLMALVTLASIMAYPLLALLFNFPPEYLLLAIIPIALRVYMAAKLGHDPSEKTGERIVIVARATIVIDMLILAATRFFKSV